MKTHYGRDVRNKKLVSILEKEGIKSVRINFMDGFASIGSDDEETDKKFFYTDNSIEIIKELQESHPRGKNIRIIQWKIGF